MGPIFMGTKLRSNNLMHSIRDESNICSFLHLVHQNTRLKPSPILWLAQNVIEIYDIFNELCDFFK